jgi:putative ABC transport system substrate-binding protein
VRRREFITLLGGATVAWPLAVRAQQPAPPLIGFLGSLTPEPLRAQLAAFHRALNEAGYSDGQTVELEFRWAEGRYDRLPALAADLVARLAWAAAEPSGGCPYRSHIRFRNVVS